MNRPGIKKLVPCVPQRAPSTRSSFYGVAALTKDDTTPPEERVGILVGPAGLTWETAACLDISISEARLMRAALEELLKHLDAETNNSN